MSNPQLLIQNLSFHIAQTKVAFNDVTLSFDSKKYGIVGNNGIGKTTLLKLLCGIAQPEKGSVQSTGRVMYLPQSHQTISRDATITDALQVEKYLSALKRVNDNDYQENDFELLDNQWGIEARIQASLEKFHLWPIDPHQKFHALSGGQKTKVLLASTLIFPCDYILMDEPTNNLDQSTREILYQFITETPQGVIVVSHDRALLNAMNEILEISSLGIKVYGGHYDSYCAQKTIERDALNQEYLEAQHAIKKATSGIQTSKEKYAHAASRGEKAFRQGHVDKLTARSKQGRSEKTNRKMATQAESIISARKKSLSDIASKIEHPLNISATMGKTSVPAGKTVIHIENLSFQYDDNSHFICRDFCLHIQGAERVTVSGKNGAGKSTLLQLIMGNLQPTSGHVYLGMKYFTYLDQSASLLSPDKTLVENFLTLNPGSTTFDAYHALATFQFRNTDAEKYARHLSGGERIRAGLAISLLSKTPPQLIILDEPTNHLDLRSIAAIESILNDYQGAIIAVSHDAYFLKHIGMERDIRLDTLK